ncbi:MAG TPA: tetratricopeptide repeat protein [Tenuifilum sp.]|uniref:SpoIIE family protein phosphatase n=1 Tax=Tenuifilum sp. TaxID=2760880 RepID=UPI002D005299|nr:tetratricopeptide repeat protein [Tenuifilum sp.]HQI89002.1 tetratricopeptide repeat protein [Tenuifilum sp.]
MKQIKLIFLLFYVMATAIHAVGQQEIVTIPKEKQDDIDRYKELVVRYKQANNSQQAAFYLNKIAFIYWEFGNPKEAINYFLETIPLNEKVGNYNDIKAVYSNIALIYSDMDRLDLTLEYFYKSLEARRKLNNKGEVAAGLIDVAYIHTALNQSEKAIQLLEEALELSREVNNPRLILNSLKLLAQNYDNLGNKAKATEYGAMANAYEQQLATQQIKTEYETKVVKSQAEAERERMQRTQQELLMSLRELQSKAMQDSLNFVVLRKQDSLRKAEEEAQRKQTEIDLLNTDRMLKEAQLREREAQSRVQRIIILAGAIFVLVLIISSVAIYKNYTDKKKANELLNLQNIEIQQQRDQIQKQNENISKSINYAQGIQRALLPPQSNLQAIFPESFIFFRPRDVVSGDYYWFKELTTGYGSNEKTGKVAVSAIDCTGHGVPGAFLSMIGYNLLDDIVFRGIHKPGAILTELNNGIRRTLRQDETDNRDGMDMALCVVDTKTNIVEFSGAKNPLVYVVNNEVNRIRGDKESIGGGMDYRNDEFTTHVIKVESPTWFYMFSDGFIDQFGGPDGRKYMIKNFIDLLAGISILPPDQQREILKNTLKDWLGTKYPQVDDILVVGFKIDPK